MSEQSSGRHTGRVVLVTGASRGIGAHLATAFAEDGYAVAGLARSTESLSEVTGRMADAGHRFLPLACDVTDQRAVEETVGRVVAELGRVDVLVNNAGLVEPEVPLWEGDPDTWWQVMTTNVRGPFLLCRSVVPVMIRQGGGRVINLNSGAGTRERAELTAYCASKSALSRITGGIALAGREHGVHAFDLAPGVVETDMTHGMRMHVGRTEWTDPGDVAGLALALAAGELDGMSGRLVRAGADAVDVLREVASRDLPEGARMLRLRPWGPDDPLG
jgi:NAD(P)-dependent dehydrogenase (short-subunit alcohol dehydrogenase family)